MIRVLCQSGDEPHDWDAREGPVIGDANDYYFLKGQPWIEFKMTSIARCKEDGVIPWLRSASIGGLNSAEKCGCPIALGPNVCFGNEQQPEICRPELGSKVLHRMLMLNDINMQQALEIAPEENREKIRHVCHFLRPRLYQEPFHYVKKWDILFSVRGGVAPWTRFKWTNHTALVNGWYTFDELVYKAQHSEVCLHSCVYESYGLAVHEINALGCPIVHDSRSLRTPNYQVGMTVPVVTANFEDQDEVCAAVEVARAMDRRRVYEAAMDFSSVDRLRRKYEEALT